MVSIIKPKPLTAENFAPFGEVIEATERAKNYLINNNTCRRYHNLAGVDATDEEGKAGISIFVAEKRPLPLDVAIMERHPLGSQAFIPLDNQPYLVLVALGENMPASDDYYAFWATGRQGVNYKKNCWHHPLIATHEPAHFLVVDRIGGGNNLQEIAVCGLKLVV